MDLSVLASSVVTVLIPYLPTLLNIAAAGAEGFSRKVGEHAAEFTIEKAQSLWKKLTERPEAEGIQKAAKAVEAVPDDVAVRMILVRRIANQLENDPALAQEITVLIGGETRIQSIHASNGSEITDAVQQMSGSGDQSITAKDNSSIKGVKQIIDNHGRRNE